MPTIEFAGSRHCVDREPFSIGREGDLVIDENPFLHRRFLTMSRHGGVWTLRNVGDRLTATVSDGDGRLEAFLAPGAVLPIISGCLNVRFTAGPTTYELTIWSSDPEPATGAGDVWLFGETTVGRVNMTPDQRRLIVALAEPALRGESRAVSALPSSSEAARRLGWTTTKFTRKLDNVCQKLSAAGVRGLHGDPGRLASNRRSRLVEYALAVRLVTAQDLPSLDHAIGGDADGDG
ncbi:MAG: hypothetical protein ACRDZ2_14075 [Ilumatobacteraceae bacterium]